MKRDLIAGAAWMAASRLLVNLLAFAGMILLARLLTPDDFGVVAIASSITTIIAAITELSLAQALVQHRDPQEDHFHTAWTLNLARSLILAAVTASIALPLANLYGDQRLAPILAVIAAATLLGGAANPKLVVFQRNLVFWQDFAVSVAQKLAGFVVSIAIAVTTQSYWALVWGLVATQVCAVVLSYAFLPFKPRLRLSGARDLLGFSVWMSLAQAISTLNWRSDQIAIGYLLGAKQLGFYTMSDNLAVLPTREATQPIAQALFPSLARISEDPPRLRAAYTRAQSFLCAIAFPLGFGFALVAQPVVALFLSEKWLPIVPLVQFLAGTFAFQTLSNTLQPLAMATGNTKALFRRDVRALLIRVPCVLGGLFVGQATGVGAVLGVVWGRSLSSFIATVWNMQLVERIIGISPMRQARGTQRAMLATAAMLGASFLLDASSPGFTRRGGPALEIAAEVALGAATYLGTTLLVWLLHGRPAGPEREAIEVGRKLVARLSRRPAVEPSAGG